MTDRQARSLDVMLAEVNRHAPNRSRASDGGRGDSAHADRTSDHNPNAAGVWRAYDVTHDPANGLDAGDLANRVAGKLHRLPALGIGAYVIWNRRIISAARIQEGWRNYAGINPHTKHVHISVATAPAGYDDTTAWRLWPPADPPSRIDLVVQRYRRERVVDMGLLDAAVAAGRTGTVKDTRDEIDQLMRRMIREVPR